MRLRLIHALLLSAAAGLPSECVAQQGPDIGVVLTALVSIQPTDDTYGGPYLSEGLGGTGPGWGIGVTSILPSRLVAAGEFTTARFEAVQSGRLINGDGPNQGAERTSRLWDSLISQLVE